MPAQRARRFSRADRSPTVAAPPAQAAGLRRERGRLRPLPLVAAPARAAGPRRPGREPTGRRALESQSTASGSTGTTFTASDPECGEDPGASSPRSHRRGTGRLRRGGCSPGRGRPLGETVGIAASRSGQAVAERLRGGVRRALIASCRALAATAGNVRYPACDLLSNPTLLGNSHYFIRPLPDASRKRPKSSKQSAPQQRGRACRNAPRPATEIATGEDCGPGRGLSRPGRPGRAALPPARPCAGRRRIRRGSARLAGRARCREARCGARRRSGSSSLPGRQRLPRSTAARRPRLSAGRMSAPAGAGGRSAARDEAGGGRRLSSLPSRMRACARSMSRSASRGHWPRTWRAAGDRLPVALGACPAAPATGRRIARRRRCGGSRRAGCHPRLGRRGAGRAG